MLKVATRGLGSIYFVAKILWDLAEIIAQVYQDAPHIRSYSASLVVICKRRESFFTYELRKAKIANFWTKHLFPYVKPNRNIIQ